MYIGILRIKIKGIIVYIRGAYFGDKQFGLVQKARLGII